MTESLKKRIVLIGGAGFIGHHLGLLLAERGAEVHIVDSLQVNNLVWLTSTQDLGDVREFYVEMVNERLRLLRKRGIALHTLDARDYHMLSNLLGRIKPQMIVQLAAVAHAGRSNKDPYSTFDHSLRTLENALDFARDYIEQFVYFSSSMVYGNFQTESIVEKHPLEPIGIYGALKLGGEKLVIAYNQVFKLPYTIVRPSALYGPRCTSRRVIQIFIEAAMAGKPLQVTGDGSERLDFTYIDDLVQGIYLTLAKPEARNQIFNMTYGQSRTVKDVVEVMRGYFPQLKVENVKRDDLVPFRGTLDVGHARTVLGYDPQFPLEKGLERYIQWYRDALKKQ